MADTHAGPSSQASAVSAAIISVKGARRSEARIRRRPSEACAASNTSLRFGPRPEGLTPVGMRSRARMAVVGARG